MKILSMSHLDIWPLGEGKGIPSVFASQKEFVKRGHQVYFICPRKRENSALTENYEGINISRFKLPFNLSTIKALSMPKDTLLRHLRTVVYYNLEWFFFQILGFYWLLRSAARIKPDLIYVHTITPMFISFLVSKIYPSHLVVRVYGARDLYQQWDSFWYRIKESRDYLSLKIPADYFIVTNDGTNANILLEKLGISPDKIKNWRNGVDFSIAGSPGKNKEEICRILKIKTSAKIILSTATINRYYGLDILIEALPPLFKKNPDIFCVITGEGPERKRLEKYVNRNNISSRVFFLGLLDHNLLARFLNTSDIFILLSRFSNCSNTMWEAMVCGKCIVTTENRNIQEVITSGENGILVHPDEFRKVPEILEKLLTDDELRNKLGRNARLKAEEILETWPERINREIRLLEDLVRK